MRSFNTSTTQHLQIHITTNDNFEVHLKNKLETLPKVKGTSRVHRTVHTNADNADMGMSWVYETLGCTIRACATTNWQGHVVICQKRAGGRDLPSP